jgi:uncharacterized protein (TIGR02246 family)
MKSLLIALLAIPSLALAAHDAADASSNPMEGWKPPKVTSEAKDKQEIQALLRSMEAAGKKGDLEAAAALVDFPVMMMTDDSKGQGKAEAWDRDRWTEVMRPFYAKPMEDVKVKHKPTIFLLSDSLASVQDTATMTMGEGAKPVTVRNSMLLVRTDGKWRVKAMAEGGWGDVMKASQGTASGEQGAPAEGTGSGAAEPPAPGEKGKPSEGTGSGTATPPAPGAGAGGGEKAQPEGTTK